MTLLTYRHNVYSQNGEDGVIAELLSRLGLGAGDNHWCVEFGAWDGKHLSNTFNLVKGYDWNAVYIEGDPVKFRDLRTTANEFERVRPILSMVQGHNGSGSSLDDLLKTTEIPFEYNLLSIDIDSSDLDVWAHHQAYRPSIVVIEINSSLLPGVLQWHGLGAIGNSFSSTLNVAQEKGYTLVCHTGNLIFVKNELIELVGLDELDSRFPERLFLQQWISHDPRVTFRDRALKLASRMPKSVKRFLKKVIAANVLARSV